MKDVENSRLLDVMGKKKKFLNDMYLLTEKQLEFIKTEELENLEEIINKKNLIIEQIDEIDLEVNSFKFKEQIENQNLAQILVDIENILSRIKVLDDENNYSLSKLMSDMKGDIKDLRKGIKVMKNYSNSDPYQAFASQGGTLFIDQDS